MKLKRYNKYFLRLMLVKEIVTIPEIPEDGKPKMYMENNTIYSTQLYNSYVGDKVNKNIDVSMSDAAVLFYESAYSDLLDGQKLLKLKEVNGRQKWVINDNLQLPLKGNVMNSFDEMAKILMPSDLMEKAKQDEKWGDDYVAVGKYYHQYRCLANYWLVPEPVIEQDGYKKFNKHDAVDLFIETIKDSEELLQELYFIEDEEESIVETYKDFERMHHLFNKRYEPDFLKETYIDDDKIRLLTYDEKYSKFTELTKKAMHDIDDRSEYLAMSKQGEKVFEAFEEVGFLDRNLSY